MILVIGLILITFAAFAAKAASAPDAAKLSFNGSVDAASVIGIGLGISKSAQGIDHNPEASG